MPDPLFEHELEQFRLYRSVFLTPYGQKVLADLMEITNFLRLTNPVNDYQSFVMKGRRDVIRYIFEKIGVASESQSILKAIASVHVKGPEPFEDQEGEDEFKD